MELKGKYDDPNARLSSVVQTYKTLLLAGSGPDKKIDDRITFSISTVSLR